ncbi:MAG: flagellar biosynthesis anti-sigma factor FlgM [Bacillota bacterium]|nr:flagellar biosynthesis anti-sigma factor FlgM [Bacillota bacterium]MDW7684685.1 flagellar biosynthesis anti-sigma factor FlgM [Bacillota bacterium]
MKINGKGFPVNKLYQHQLENDRKANGTAKDKPAGDSLSISSESAKISELIEAAATPADIRAERVRELKEQIAQGKYTVDSQKLAEAMLAKNQ